MYKLMSRVSGAIAILILILLETVFMAIWFNVDFSTLHTAIQLVLFLVGICLPIVIGLYIGAQLEQALDKEYEETLNYQRERAHKSGFEYAIDCVRMISHKKFFKENVKHINKEGDKEMISMYDYLMRSLQRNKEKRYK